MSSWKFIIDADFNGEVIADYESEGSIKSVDNNMTITTIMTMMKMLKMTVTGMTVTILKMLQRLMKTSV